MNPRTVTRTFVFVALMLDLGVAGAYAQDRHGPVKMTFSGTNVATTINLQANTVTDEMHAAGKGSLGRFTFRELHADGIAPQPPAGCTGPYFGVLKGAGVFSFQDGSLLIVTGIACSTKPLVSSRTLSALSSPRVISSSGSFQRWSNRLPPKSAEPILESFCDSDIAA